MGAFKQFVEDHDTDKELLWSGTFNRSTILIYSRQDTGAEEIYATSEDGVLVAAADQQAFLEKAQPEDFIAEFDPEDPTSILIFIGGEVFTFASLEVDDDGTELAVVDIQLEDDELDYLKVNGVLPDVKFGDLDLTDPAENPEDDFWQQ